MSFDQQPCADILSRHRAFWQRQAVDWPLILAQPRRIWAPKPYPLLDGDIIESRCILPDNLDLDRMANLGQPLPTMTAGDLMNSVGCSYPAAWLEAVAGCPIYASAYGCVARPAVGSLEEALERFSVPECLQSPWLQAIAALLKRLRERAGTLLAVQQLHFRGVIDILAAYLGEELLCMAALDEPDGLVELARRMTELHLAVARWEAAQRPAWQGGAVSCWRMYAPGPLLDYQIDASSLFSVDTYRQLFAPFDRAVLREFPYSLIHLHSVGLQHLDTVLDLPVTCVEINLDREAMPWDRKAMLQTCRQVQESGKALLINGELSIEDLQVFTESLDPAGLAIDCWHETA